ncbi:MAG TPA: membrane dipeptidase [Clostridiaceae bacterium]|nr:membrane dipeptidase [Clostridiaceae bacterium]
MIIVDAHCDTLSRIYDDKMDLMKNNFHVDIERMQKYDGYVQFFAAFIDPAYCQAYAMRRAVQLIDKFYSQAELYKDNISLCYDIDSVNAALKERKIAAILTIEGGDALQGDLAALRTFYKLGVRSLCLTWNYRNEIADGVEDSSSDRGLTYFGRVVVREMNSLGMIIDISHISEKGFWDVIELSKAPVIASHSNAKAICNHIRNLTDSQIIAIKDNGGVIGINFYPYFLNNTAHASVKNIIRHIEYIASLIGCDNIGIGADFDGIDCTPLDISGVQDMYKVINELLRLNYTEKDVEKIAGGNFIRVISQVLR